MGQVDQGLLERVRRRLAGRTDVEEKAMMGGVTFMVSGKMCVGVLRDELVCRIAPEDQEEALGKVGARPMDFTGRPMKGFLMISPLGLKGEGELAGWVDLALAFNGRAKASKPRKRTVPSV
ncbi:MAG: TfoX/Sxy family protein [Fibrobacteria bacterium]|nr:TfoX/Sxy family protein [Fibrobacteria bacterium]